MYGSETLLWKEKERSRVRAVQMDNLRGLLGIRRMDRIQNAWIKECGVMKGVHERIEELFLQLFPSRGWKRTGLLREYVGECAGSRSGVA